jgi:hypothetical protein
VTFRNEETAELALKSPSQKRVLDGRVVAFSKAEPKKEGWLKEASSGSQAAPQHKKEYVVEFDGGKCHVHKLPDEILVKVFRYLNVKELVLMERGRMRDLSVLNLVSALSSVLLSNDINYSFVA